MACVLTELTWRLQAIAATALRQQAEQAQRQQQQQQQRSLPAGQGALGGRQDATALGFPGANTVRCSPSPPPLSVVRSSWQPSLSFD